MSPLMTMLQQWRRHWAFAIFNEKAPFSLDVESRGASCNVMSDFDFN
jgi:hypothetical protein